MTRSGVASKPDGERLGRALARAVGWHGTQVRKGTTVPYVSHLLHVAGLVLEHGGDDEQAVAALLHDAVEDTHATAEEIEREFGRRVAEIVLDATDTLPGDEPDAKSPWIDRKRRHLEHLASIDPGSALVVACDKRHNLGALVEDLRASGAAAVAPRFNSTPEQWVWYYGEAITRLRDRLPPRLVAELEALHAELRRLVSSPSGPGAR